MGGTHVDGIVDRERASRGSERVAGIQLQFPGIAGVSDVHIAGTFRSCRITAIRVQKEILQHNVAGATASKRTV